MRVFQNIVKRARTWVGKLDTGEEFKREMPWLWVYGDEPVTDIIVDEKTSLRFSAVWCAIKIISESVSNLPLPIYRRLEGKNKQEARNHPLWDLLHYESAPGVEAGTWIEVMTAHMALYGNGYSIIQRNRRNEIIALQLLDPQHMEVRRNKQGEVVYKYSGEDRWRGEYRNREIFHLRGMGFDGLVGYSPIAVARRSVELAMAAERFGAALFGKGGRPGGILKLPPGVKDEQRKKFEIEWNAAMEKRYGHAVAFLSGDVDWKPMMIPPEDAQFLETRRYQIGDIARLYRIPPHMLADLTEANYANIYEQNRAFARDCIGPAAGRWERAIGLQLMTPEDRVSHFVEFNFDALLRANTKERAESHAIELQNGALTINEWRQHENRPPIEGGDTVFIAANNMQPLEKVLGGDELDDDLIVDDEEDDGDEGVMRSVLPSVADAVRRWYRRVANATTRASSKSAEDYVVWAQRWLIEQRDAWIEIMYPSLSGVAEWLGLRGSEEFACWLEQRYDGDMADMLYRLTHDVDVTAIRAQASKIRADDGEEAARELIAELKGLTNGKVTDRTACTTN